MCSSLKIIVLSEDLILWYYVLSLRLYICLWMYWITQHCDYHVLVLTMLYPINDLNLNLNFKRLKFIYSVQRPVSLASISGLYVISEAAFTIALLGGLLYNFKYKYRDIHSNWHFIMFINNLKFWKLSHLK